MLKLLTIIPMLALLSACDAPMRGRTIQTVNGEGYGVGGSFNPTPAPGNTIGSGLPATAGFENCDLTTRYHVSALGHLGLCQNTQDETLFRFRPTMTDTTTRTCLIPTYKEASGSSTYIGQPQCTHTEAEKVVQGKLLKNRQGFEGYPLNGVMLMKERLLPEYFNCMHGYVNWLQIACPQGAGSSPYCSTWVPNCPYGARTNATCDRAAQEFRVATCNAFKTNHSNAYLDIRTK
jgi:hypothetical protein